MRCTLFFICLFAFYSSCALAADADRSPNIVVIFIDDKC